MFGPLIGRQWQPRATVRGMQVRPARLWGLLAAVPFALIVAASVGDFYAIRASREKDQAELLLVQCQTLADELDLQVSREAAVLRGLAASVPMAQGDMDGLSAAMFQAGSDEDATLVYVDNQGKVLSATTAPVKPIRVHAPEVISAIGGTQPVLTNVFRSSTYTTNRLAVVYPLPGADPSGARRGALIYSIAPRTLIALLSTRHLPRLTSVRFIDRNGVVAAGTDMPDPSGQPASPRLLAELVGHDQGTSSTDGQNGRLIMAWARAPKTRFVVKIVEPQRSILPTFGEALWPVVGVPLLCLCAIPLVTLARRRIVRGSPLAPDVSVLALRVGVDAGSQDLAASPHADDAIRRHGDDRTPPDMRRDQSLHAHRLEVMGTLASGVAHDFGNVLQVLDGSLRIIRDSPNDVATVQHSTEIMLDVLGGARSMVRRLLSFAREEALDITDCDVAATLGGIAEILRHTFPRQIAISLDAPADLPGMHVDKARLEAALLNVATNAKHAMPTGGTFSLSARVEAAPQIGPDATNRLKGLFIRIDATDNGVGMSAATLARATDAFFTTKPAGQGTGLGLSATRSFAEESGGALWLSSELGVGTTVSLWLPQAIQTTSVIPPGVSAPSASAEIISPPPILPSPNAAADVAVTMAEPPVATPEPPAPTLVPPRVLLVDDEPMIRDVLARQLSRRGINVMACLDAAEAVAALTGTEPFDLLLTDFAMPDMPGDVLIARARALRPGLPVIVLTGHPHDAEVLGDRTQDAMIRLLRKPISGRELADEIDSMLGRPQS